MNIIIAKKLMVDAPNKFENFLKEIGKTIEERGLTPVILDRILAEDD
ncbi:hypothetical protein [Pricia sp.]